MFSALNVADSKELRYNRSIVRCLKRAKGTMLLFVGDIDSDISRNYAVPNPQRALSLPQRRRQSVLMHSFRIPLVHRGIFRFRIADRDSHYYLFFEILSFFTM